MRLVFQLVSNMLVLASSICLYVAATSSPNAPDCVLTKSCRREIGEQSTLLQVAVDKQVVSDGIAEPITMVSEGEMQGRHNAEELVSEGLSGQEIFGMVTKGEMHSRHDAEEVVTEGLSGQEILGMVSEGIGQCRPFGHTWSPDFLSHNIEDGGDLIRAYYINSEASLERRSTMEKELRAASLEAKRFPAVSPEHAAFDKLSSEYTAAQGVSNFFREWPEEQNTTVACYISHVEAMKQAQRELEADQVVLIMEDDVSIPSNFKLLAHHTMDLAPTGWALLKLSHWGFARSPDIVAEPKFGEDEKLTFHALRPPFREVVNFTALTGGEAVSSQRSHLFYAGTAGYLVKVSSIPLVLAHLERQPIDNIDSMMLSNGELQSYQVSPQMICLNELSKKSSIVGHLPPDWYLLPHSANMSL